MDAEAFELGWQALSAVATTDAESEHSPEVQDRKQKNETGFGEFCCFVYFLNICNFFIYIFVKSVFLFLIIF